MTPRVLEVLELSKTYADGTVALRGVSFGVEGGIFGLLGENGAGKSTTLSILALQMKATSGTVHYGDDRAEDAGSHAAIRRRLGFLPQAFQPVLSLTGWEYLTHCARLRGVLCSSRQLRERVGALLEATDLIGWASRPTREYSGGMKRRLGVCQALVHGPELVVLDEPSAGLDPEQRFHLRSFIADLGRRHTILLSSHVVDDIDQTSNQMAVLSAGRLLYQGSPSALLSRFSSYLWELPRAASAGGASDVERPLLAGVHLLGYVGESGARVVYATSRPPGATGHRATLEDAYGALLAEARNARPLSRAPE